MEIDAGQRALLEGGCALIVGTVDVDGRPHASRAWSLEVLDPASAQVRILLAADDPAALRNVTTGRLAITATDVLTLRSLQMKGGAVLVEDATAADRRRSERYRDAFHGNIERADGTPRALTERLVPRDLRACVAVLDESYDQTPGPGAGRPTGP